jgi:excisionase family DNA binding protein
VSVRSELLARAVSPELLAALDEHIRDVVDEALAEREQTQQWLTVEEYAATMRTTVDAVRKRLERRRIPSARKEGKLWLIPVAATLSSDLTTRGERRRNGLAPDTRR